MNFYEVLKTKIDRLIKIRLTDGVQPEDLSNNIFLKDYKKITFYKDKGKIIGELTFEEEIDDKLFCTILRYIYNENKRLLRIEEQINDNIRIEWDRDFIEDVLINDIIDIMKNHYENRDIEYFLRSLPDDLISKIEHACGYVA